MSEAQSLIPLPIALGMSWVLSPTNLARQLPSVDFSSAFSAPALPSASA